MECSISAHKLSSRKQFNRFSSGKKKNILHVDLVPAFSSAMRITIIIYEDKNLLVCYSLMYKKTTTDAFIVKQPECESSHVNIQWNKADILQV